MKQSRKPAENNSDFVPSERKAKSNGTTKSSKTENFAKARKSENTEKIEIIEKIVRLARKERLSYDDFIYVCQQAHKKLGLKNRERKNAFRRFFPNRN